MSETLKDKLTFELAEYQRKKEKKISVSEVSEKILEQAKKGKKKLDIKGFAIDPDDIQQFVQDGIKVIDDFVPDDLIPKILHKLCGIRSIRFDWDDEEEQLKKKALEELELKRVQALEDLADVVAKLEAAQKELEENPEKEDIVIEVPEEGTQ